MYSLSVYKLMVHRPFTYCPPMCVLPVTQVPFGLFSINFRNVIHHVNHYQATKGNVYSYCRTESTN